MAHNAATSGGDSSQQPPPNVSNKKTPIRPVTPRLRVVLYVVLTLFGVLAANGMYLTSITWLQEFTGEVYETHFYQLMFLMHLGLGLLLILPVVVFGFLHMWRSRNRRNRRAVKIGYALLAVALTILVSGLLLMRVGSFSIVNPTTRDLVYWMHFLTPLAAVWLYWLHRLVGPRIKWHVGRRVALAIGCFVVLMVGFQASDPRISGDESPLDGDKYFEPSLARTATGKFVSAKTLMNDEYCLKCHEDIYDSALHSAHKLSSFNNPAYRASVRETRKVATERAGSVQASRWCAGCHDPVPFFSGRFDDPNYDDVNDPTAHAGITCAVCHAIQSVDSHVGNADYTIDEPKHYPFAYSDNPILSELNLLMVKAKPAFHKHEMLKPLHKTPEFCGTCHKVSLPGEVTAYKEFLRGQNHYDSYLLSGVSGHGARSFYYPPKAEANCNECHMPAVASNEFGAKYMEQLGGLGVHTHAFPSANSALGHWMGDKEQIELHRSYLTGTLRVDLFGLRQEGSIDGVLNAPLADSANVEKGQTYLIETVLRTMKLGHHFSQGTTDSNQIWIEMTAKQGDQLIGHSGHRDEREVVDAWSHFVNTFMLDREGNRINRRNAQNIFTPLYSHQIPPGAGQTVHYKLAVPEDSDEPIVVTAKLLYRKFDTEYLDYIRRDRDPAVDPLDLGLEGDPNDLPIIEIASDQVTLNVVETADAATVDASAARSRTRSWVARALVGLNTCPFTASADSAAAGLEFAGIAAAPILYAESGARDVPGLAGDFWEAAGRMLERGQEGCAGVVLSAPAFDGDWETWHAKVFPVLEESLLAAGLGRELGVVCFHPSYETPGLEFLRRHRFGHMHHASKLLRWVDAAPDARELREARSGTADGARALGCRSDRWLRRRWLELWAACGGCLPPP